MSNTHRKCPIDNSQLYSINHTDAQCPKCGRVWYETGNKEAPLATRTRKITMKKFPQKGDNLNDIIEPLDN